MSRGIGVTEENVENAIRTLVSEWVIGELEESQHLPHPPQVQTAILRKDPNWDETKRVFTAQFHIEKRAIPGAEGELDPEPLPNQVQDYLETVNNALESVFGEHLSSPLSLTRISETTDTVRFQGSFWCPEEIVEVHEHHDINRADSLSTPRPKQIDAAD